MKDLYSIAIIFFILVINSCSNETNQEGKLMHNEYTAIVLRACDEIGEYKFRTSDTYYFDLKSVDPLETFVFISDVNCGFAGGSCGANIEVFKKNGNGYNIAYNRCGFHAKKLDESNFGINSFTLDVRLYPGGVEPFYKHVKVSWDGKRFNESVIQERTQL